MNILFLDDDENRHWEINRLNRGRHDIHKVYTAKECIEALQEGEWDMLFLDHDLGGEVYVDSANGTGYEVAEFLEANNEYQPPKMYIHSFNPVGAKNMHNCIPEAIVKPISLVYKQFEEIIRG